MLFIPVTDWVAHCRAHYRRSIEFSAQSGVRRGSFKHNGRYLVGPGRSNEWAIKDAPLFTDIQPNADMLNN